MNKIDTIIALLTRIAEALEEQKTRRNAPKGAKLPKAPYDDILSAWHQHCPMLTQPTVMSEGRENELNLFWSKMPKGMDDVHAIFAAVSRSKFLTGKTWNPNGKPFKADLWWVINPRNLANILDGKYQ